LKRWDTVPNARSFQDVFVDSSTLEEVLANVQEAIVLYLGASLERGLQLPEMVPALRFGGIGCRSTSRILMRYGEKARLLREHEAKLYRQWCRSTGQN
jgi:hypothetical protein